MGERKKKLMEPHYSGDLSVEFWKRVNALKNRENRASCYSIGVILQNVESDVLRILHNCEATDGR